MTQVNFKNDLRVFNEKVGELESSSFFAKASGAGYIVEFKHEQGWDALFVGPDEESIKALVLTLRLFMQNNDRLSLQKMRALYKSPPVSAGLVAEFSHLCDQLNQFLDSGLPACRSKMATSSHSVRSLTSSYTGRMHMLTSVTEASSKAFGRPRFSPYSRPT